MECYAKKKILICVARWVNLKRYHVEQKRPDATEYSRSPTYEPSSCELSKIQTSVRMSDHIS